MYFYDFRAYEYAGEKRSGYDRRDHAAGKGSSGRRYKEKVIAAHRAGVKKVLLPKDNMKDIDELPQNVRKELEFRFDRNDR